MVYHVNIGMVLTTYTNIILPHTEQL